MLPLQELRVAVTEDGAVLHQRQNLILVVFSAELVFCGGLMHNRETHDHYSTWSFCVTVWEADGPTM